MRDWNRVHVYFAEHPTEPIIKIGSSIHPLFRVTTLKERPRIIGVLLEHPTRKSGEEWVFEYKLFRKFKHLRVRREWYKDCEELRLFILRSGAHSQLWASGLKLNRLKDHKEIRKRLRRAGLSEFRRIRK